MSYVTVIDVPNPDLKLKPGMTAAVTIETGRADEAIKVPNAALRFRPTQEAFEALGQKPPERRPQGLGEPQRPSGDSGAVWVLGNRERSRVSLCRSVSATVRRPR